MIKDICIICIYIIYNKQFYVLGVLETQVFLRKNAAETTTTTSHGFLQEMLGVCLQKLAELDEAMEARKKRGAM